MQYHLILYIKFSKKVVGRRRFKSREERDKALADYRKHYKGCYDYKLEEKETNDL